MHFFLDVLQMTAIVLVSVIDYYHINELHLFWDTLYNSLQRIMISSYLKLYNSIQIFTIRLEYLKS